MPKIYLSKPISSPAVLASEREHVMFIGAGAGIATFLCFVDREFILSTRAKGSLANFDNVKESINKKMDLVFICRELVHMRWMAKYINAVLTVPAMTNKMIFHIYITVKPESNNFSSYLFWRSMIMFNREQEKLKKKGHSLNIKLGRPNFDKLIKDVCIDNDIKSHHIYACGPRVMTKGVEDIVKNANTNLRDTGREKKTIVFNYEIF